LYKFNLKKINQGNTEIFWHIAMLHIQVVGESGRSKPGDIALVREAGVGAVCQLYLQLLYANDRSSFNCQGI
jgi:hypothetical protein